MRILLFVMCLVILSASLASAQGGTIVVFADPAGITCDLLDLPGAAFYYVIHTNVVGTTGSQFKVYSEHLGTVIEETPRFPATFGTPTTGASVGYGACLTGPITVFEMLYLCIGLTPPCARMQVVEHPSSVPPGLFSSDCNYELVPAIGWTSYINGDGSCPCGNWVIPTEKSTWGKVKELYAE